MAAPRCSQHGRVLVPHPPVQACQECWALFGQWCAVQMAAPASRGYAKGRGQSSKAKGRSAVLAVAELVRTVLGLPVEDVWVKATSQVGTDLHLSARARTAFPFSVEVKNVEAFNIWQALRQAAENAPPDLAPVVFFKRARTPLYAALDARQFVELVQHAHQSRRSE